MKLKLEIKENQRVFFSSDLHYSHKNLCRGESKWENIENCRDFETVKNMNFQIISGINNKVGQDDILFLLGDFSFGDSYNIYDCRSKILCSTIYCLAGNHDQNISKNKPIQTSHGIEYPLNQFNLFTDVIEVEIKGYKFFLSHYCHRVWPGSHKGTIHLFGHSHGKYQGMGKMLDVGIDNAYKSLGRYEPFSYDEILKLVDK